mgnify:CR=1 FL=1
MADIANIHPIIVHFPIALLSGFLIAEILGLLSGSKDLRTAAKWMLYFGTLGALVAASLARKVTPKIHISFRSLIGAVIGGLLMGYGARLAFGCNIGAMFSGIASGSVHGWLWFVSAFLGSYFGIKLRPHFGLL